GALDDVADAVEFRGRATQPERVQAGELAGTGVGHQRFRHHGESATQPGESAVFGEAAEFDRALECAGDFVDRMRDLRLENVSLIGRVVEEYRSVLQRVIHPANQLRAGGDRAGRIVWITEVNDVQYFVRNLCHETIGGGAGQIKQSLVCAGFVRRARVAGHHVGIDVNRIYRVHQTDFVLLPEDVQN